MGRSSVDSVQADAGIDLSVGSVGDSFDNAFAESLIGLYKCGFPIWLWYFCPSDQLSRLDCLGFRERSERSQATEGDTQWVNYKPSHFSSRSTDF